MKKLIIFLLVFAQLAVLSACAGKNGGGDEQTSGSEVQTSAESDVNSRDEQASDSEAQTKAESDEKGGDEQTSGTEAQTTAEPAVKGSEGLEYALTEDGESYTVLGIGTCKDTDLVIPSEYLGKPVVSISGWFEDNNDLTSVYISKGIRSISGEETFKECENLRKVTLPDGLEYIGFKAFRGCKSLKEVNIPASVKYIGQDAFEGCPVREIKLPSGITSVGNGAFAGTLIEEITVPGSVVEIGENAFCNCKSLKKVVLEEGLQTVSEGMFHTCEALETVTIPASVTKIGRSVFLDCGELKKVYFTGTVADWCLINFGDHAMFDRNAQIELFIGGELQTDLVISDGVSEIPPHSFQYVDCIRTLTIPTSVKKIGNAAFSLKSITDVYYQGTEEEWNNIEIDDRGGFDRAEIHFAG